MPAEALKTGKTRRALGIALAALCLGGTLFAVAGPDASPRLRGSLIGKPSGAIGSYKYWTSTEWCPHPPPCIGRQEVYVKVDSTGNEYLVARKVDGRVKMLSPGGEPLPKGWNSKAPAKQEEASPAIGGGPDGPEPTTPGMGRCIGIFDICCESLGECVNYHTCPDGSGDKCPAAGYTYCESLGKCLQDSDEETPCPSVGLLVEPEPTEEPVVPPKPTATVPDKLGSYWGYLGTTRVKWMVDSLGIPHVIARMVNGKQMGVKPGGGPRGGRAPRTPLSIP